jgi:iron complex transport system substrate-binding protein
MKCLYPCLCAITLAISSISQATSQHATSQHAPSQNIMSINVCADQLAIALAPERIVSLSPLAIDPVYSAQANKARHYPINSGRGEEVLLRHPAYVLAGSYDGKARLQLMKNTAIQPEIHVILIDPWTSLAQGLSHLEEIGQALNAAETSKKIIQDIKQALEALEPVQMSKKPRVAVLQRRGYSAGVLSLMGELITRMGMEPYVPKDARGLSTRYGGFLRLEHLLADPPDYVILAKEDQAAIDQGSAFLAHPTLKKALPSARRLVIPTVLSACEGPSTPDLIRAFASEVYAKVR